MDKEEIKKARLELLAKARQAKKDKKQAQLEAQLAERKQEQPVEESVKKYKSLERKIVTVNDEIVPEPKRYVRKKKQEEATPEPEPTPPEPESPTPLPSVKPKKEKVEIVQETVRRPATKHKKIIKRTIEIEESESEEEVVEEIVKIPKMKKELTINRNEMKKKLVEQNNARLHAELFS